MNNKSNDKIYLYGASGHAKVIIDILKSQNVDICGLIDDNHNINELIGYQVIHNISNDIYLIVSIGDNKIRMNLANKLEDKVNFIKAIHSSVIISDNVIVGRYIKTKDVV